MVGYLEVCYYILLPLGQSEPKHLKQRLSAENLLPRKKEAQFSFLVYVFNSVICSLNRYLFSAYYVLGSVLCPENSTVNKTKTLSSLCSHS